MYSVIIVAAGQSTRFEKGNKLLAKLKNQERVINQTCEVFLKNDRIENIILVSSDEIHQIVKQKFENNIRFTFVNGGSSRFLSVKNGLEKCTTPKVLIHDGARPFLKQDLLNEILDEVVQNNVVGVLPWIPVTNTLKRNFNGLKTVNREEYIQSQTPQAFDFKILNESYHNFKGEDSFDDCQVVEEYLENPQIRLVKGDITNIKITFMQDLSINT
ncbi:IspD/TarI family cytidylyltransferase [Spiroplasma endosymbiont of Panorpa germanica]|uniref:IspD/TarI family cytidylyltransferase n=1 Tax=Spiroplasma endosymbiont of Panorpa germanica TaxID=3066314 RepID=UPI0030D51CDF